MKAMVVSVALVACSTLAVAQDTPTDEEILKLMKPTRCDKIPMTPQPATPLRIPGKPAEPAKPRLETLDWMCSSRLG